MKSKEGNCRQVEEVWGRTRGEERYRFLKTLALNQSRRTRLSQTGTKVCVRLCVTTCPASNDASDAQLDTAAHSHKTLTLSSR